MTGERIDGSALRQVTWTPGTTVEDLEGQPAARTGVGANPELPARAIDTSPARIAELQAAFRVIAEGLGIDVETVMRAIGKEGQLGLVQETAPTAASGTTPHQQLRDAVREVNDLTRAARDIPLRYLNTVRDLPPELRAQTSAPTAIARRFNETILSFWPSVPHRFLLADPERGIVGAPAGPADLERLGVLMSFRLPHADGSGSSPGTAEQFLLPFLPKLHEAQKRYLLLAEHVRTAGLPTAQEIDAMKADAADPRTPLRDVYGEIAQMILDVEAMIGASEVKREVLNAGASTTVHAEDRASTEINAQGTGRSLMIDGDGSPSVAFSSSALHGTSTTRQEHVEQRDTHVWWEELNLGARQYDVPLQIGFDGPIPSHGLSLAELPVVMEKLLTARRLFEAARDRETDSPEIARVRQALGGWMNDTVLNLNFPNGGKPGQITIHLGTLRGDAKRLSTIGTGWYPRERVPYLDSEMSSTRSPQSRPKLSGMGAFSAATPDPSAMRSKAAESQRARGRAEAELQEQLGAVSVATDPRAPGALLESARLDAIGPKLNVLRRRAEGLRSAARGSPEQVSTLRFANAEVSREIQNLAQEPQVLGSKPLRDLIALLGRFGEQIYGPLATAQPREMASFLAQSADEVAAAFYQGGAMLTADQKERGENTAALVHFRAQSRIQSWAEAFLRTEAQRIEAMPSQPEPSSAASPLSVRLRGALSSIGKREDAGPPPGGTEAQARRRYQALAAALSLLAVNDPTGTAQLQRELQGLAIQEGQPLSETQRLALESLMAKAQAAAAPRPPA